MGVSTPKIAIRIKAAIQAVLPPSVDIKVKKTYRDHLVVDIAGTSLLAAWAGEGWLAQINSVLKLHDNPPDIIVARKMSEGGKVALKKGGIAWVDELGNAEFAIGTIIVSRSGNLAVKKEPTTHWTPSVVAAAEAILCTGEATNDAVIQITGLSTGSCTRALRVLTDLEFLEADTARGPTSGRRIANFAGLLEAYATAAAELSPRENLVLGVTWDDPITGIEKLGQKWSKLGVEWAVTGSVASMVLAPYLTSVSSGEVYVQANTIQELRVIAANSKLEVIKGGRLTIRPFPIETTARLSSLEDKLRVAPWPRVYADLRRSGVRGEEAAEHLSEVING